MPNGLVIPGGVSFPLLAPDGTALAPSYSFAGASNYGMYRSGTSLLWSINGSDYLQANNALFRLIAGQEFQIGTDVVLARDAANVLAQRNSSNAQTFRLYNTYTDASNYERGGLAWVSNALEVYTQKGGSGTSRALVLKTKDAVGVYLGSNDTLRWQVDSSGHLLAFATNTYDIGAAAGVTCPRTVYAATSFVAPTGSTGVLSYVFDAGYGLYRGAVGGGGAIVLTCGAADQWAVGQNSGVGTQQVGPLGFAAAISSSVADLQLARLAAASLRQGQAPSATPVAQTFTIGEASRPGTDVNVGGSSGTIRSGLGTGTGTASSLIFQTPDLVASGSTTQTYVTRLTIATAAVTSTVAIAAPRFDSPNGGVFYVYASSGGNPGAVLNGSANDGVASAAGLSLGSGLSVTWFDSVNPALGGSADLSLARLAAASLRQGLAPSATPVNQTFTIGESSRGGTDLNVAGANGTIRSGLGTGNAAGTSLIFQVSVPLASSTVAQTYTQVLSLSALGATFDLPNQGLRINGQTNAAGASTGTLTNAPVAGNPGFWLPVNIAGVVYAIPCF